MSEDRFEKLFAGIAGLILTVPLLLWASWTTHILWGWFMEEQWGLPHMSTLQAIGAALIVATFTANIPRHHDFYDILDKKDGVVSRLAQNTARGLIVPAFLLLFGFILHEVM